MVEELEGITLTKDNIKFPVHFKRTNKDLKNVKEMGLVSGFLIGAIYTILAFFVFSLLNGEFCLDAKLLNDIIFGGIAGAIAGVVAVNFKKK